VLGDVVCGGFAVPMRSGYAEEVYVVTSGEFMSLYAANNIARGIANYAAEGDVRMGGLIANVKDLAYDRTLIEKFAERIGTRVLYYLEWNKVVYEAERRRQTVVRYKPEDPFAQEWFRLAEALEATHQPHVPRPMDDNQLDVFLEELFGLPKAATSMADLVPPPPVLSVPPVASGQPVRRLLRREPQISKTDNRSMPTGRGPACRRSC